MVGVPRSKGCGLCVKRRVKCDQNRPACSNCIKYGVDCPGYEKDHKFVTGKHVVRPRGQNPRRSHETQLDFSSAPVTGSSLSTKELASSARVLNCQASNHRLQGKPTVPGSLRESVLPFVYNMMGELFITHPREHVFYTAPWFTSLLNHIGRSPVLDTAMCAFMLQLVGTSKGDEQEIFRSRDLYGQSLRSLQMELNHPVAWKSTETLATTMICCQLEVGVLYLALVRVIFVQVLPGALTLEKQLFAGTLDPLSWMVHAAGVSKLIQHRGRQCFSTPVDKALLRDFRPIIVRISRDLCSYFVAMGLLMLDQIMQCLFHGSDCFLEQPKWQKLCASLSLDTIRDGEGNEEIIKPFSALGTSWSMYNDGYFVLLAKVPPVTRVAYGVREDRKHGIAPDPSQIELLTQLAGRLRSEYRAWYDSAVSGGAITPPVEVLSQDPNSPFVTVLKFSNPWIGSVFMSYWATTLILQGALNECQVGPERPYDEDNQELAQNILRSLEYVVHGIMGPYRVAYALRIAYEFVDLPLQMWVESVLEKYSQNYAALSPEAYPRLHGKSTPHLFNDAGGARTRL